MLVNYWQTLSSLSLFNLWFNRVGTSIKSVKNQFIPIEWPLFITIINDSSIRKGPFAIGRQRRARSDWATKICWCFFISLWKHLLLHSLESSHNGASNEHPQHMFSWRNKKNVYMDMVNVLKFHTPKSDKMAYANSAYPDQTAPEGAVWSGSALFAILLIILRNNCIKSKILAQNVSNKVFELLGHLTYCSYLEPSSSNITKTSLFKFTENLITSKTENFQIKILIFYIFLLKT